MSIHRVHQFDLRILITYWAQIITLVFMQFVLLLFLAACVRVGERK